MVSFVILHYLTADDSVECIESILKNVISPDINIVVVDNGSPNHSGEVLKRKYESISQVHLIYSKKNLGFAGGNNIGYQYARNVLKSKFILVINNDTVIKQTDFVNRITEKYKQLPFDILGPDILSLKDNSHQNPRTEILTDVPTIKGFMRRYFWMYLLSFLNLDLKLLAFKKFFSPTSQVSKQKKEKADYRSETMHVKLHGSALVFSPSFIQKHNCCFYPGTFMYNEESILNFIVSDENLVTLYFPSVQILHKEDGATNSYLRSSRRKRRFYYKNFIISSRVLLNLYHYGFHVQDMQ
jgi:GT2 family glycosyltransferase